VKFSLGCFLAKKWSPEQQHYQLLVSYDFFFLIDSLMNKNKSALHPALVLSPAKANASP